MNLAVRVAWLVGVAGLFAFAVTQLKVTHSVTHFMPAGERAELLDLSRELAGSELSRTLVLSIGLEGGPAGREAELVAAARRISSRLSGSAEVSAVLSGLAEGQLEALYDVYFPRRLYFAAGEPERDIPTRLEDAALRARAEELRAALAGPGSAALSRIAPADPLGLFQAVLGRFRSAQPELDLRGGQFLTKDGRHAIVLLESRHSPFDSEHQGPLQQEIEETFEAVKHELGAPLVLEQSGIGRIALDTEASIRGDLQFISLVSIVGVSVLFLVFFRSPRSLALAIFPAAAGIAFATSLGILFIDPLHGVTVAFGVSLVGVAVDYSIHLINHHSLLPAPGGPFATLRRLRPSLLLGAGTTVAGFGGLALTSFPGVQEMGLYAMAGIAGALVVTLFGLPFFLRENERSAPAQRAAAQVLVRVAAGLRRERRALWGAVLLAVLLAFVGGSQLTWHDDPNALTLQNPELMAEDHRVRARIAQLDVARFVIAVADDPETAIAKNDIVWARLQAPLAAGALDGLRSLHSILWSVDLQRRNLEALQHAPRLGPRVDAAFQSAGFRAGAFDAFAAAVGEPERPPLVPADLEGTPLERLTRSMLVELPGRTATVTYLRGVREPAAIEAAIAGLPGVHFFDQSAVVGELYASYRRKTAQLIALGCALVFALLWLRYRAWRPSVAAFAPSILVAGAELGLFGLVGYPMNLLGLVSLILILGMGVDYAIFVVDSAKESEHLGTTMLSLLASCLTTLFVFGTLSLSAHPALRSIGLTTGVGILLAFALAPTALLLVDSERPGPGSG